MAAPRKANKPKTPPVKELQPEAFLQRLRQMDEARAAGRPPLPLAPGPYLFFGDEENRKWEALQKLRSTLLADGDPTFDETVLTAPGFGEIQEACETLPLLSRQRLVIVRDCPELEKLSQKGFEGFDDLKAYLMPEAEGGRTVPESTVLVFFTTGDLKTVADKKGDAGDSEKDDDGQQRQPSDADRADGAPEEKDEKADDGKEKKPQAEEDGSRNRVYRLLRRCAFVVEFSVPKKSAQGDVVSLTQAYFREAPYAKECSRRAAELLVQISGMNSSYLRMQIPKIAAYAGDRREITEDDVRTCASPTAEYTVFELTKAVAGNNEAAALRLLSSLDESQRTGYAFVAIVSRQYRQIQQYLVYRAAKMDRDEIMQRMGMRYDWQLRDVSQMAEQCGPREVREAIQLCTDTEYALKSGRLNDDGSAELLLLRLFAIKRGTYTPQKNTGQ